MQEVRDDALQLLDTLSSRVWKEGGATVASVRPGTPLLPGQILHASPHAAVVIGALQDSFQDFQLRLSSKLARCAHCGTCTVRKPENPKAPVTEIDRQERQEARVTRISLGF